MLELVAPLYSPKLWLTRYRLELVVGFLKLAPLFSEWPNLEVYDCKMPIDSNEHGIDYPILDEATYMASCASNFSAF